MTDEFSDLNDYSGVAMNAYKKGDGPALFSLAQAVGTEVLELLLNAVTGRDDGEYVTPDLIVALLCMKQVTTYLEHMIVEGVRHAKEAGDVEYMSMVTALTDLPRLMEVGRKAAEGELEDDVASMLEAMANGHTIQ